MLKLVRRAIRANLGRLLLTLIAVVLGVSFVSGSFILADSLRSVFNQISEDAFGGVDAQVRAVEPEFQSAEFALPRFDGAIADAVSEVPGVEYAEAGLFVPQALFAVDDDGEIVRPLGPPVFSGSWGGPSPTSAFLLVEGAAPVGQQVAMNSTQADQAGIAIGDLVTIAGNASEPQEFELSAIIDFGQEGGTGGAYFLLFDLPTMQRLHGVGGQVDSIVVNAEPGTDSATLLADIGAVLPDGLEVVSAETVVGESQADFGQIIDIFGNVLLGFAVVVLFVSIFIIYNTFAILVGQRTRQLGLLRSIGASATQIRTMMLLESVILGLAASIIGLFGGLGVAAFLKWLFSQGGAFPDGPLEIKARTIIVVFIVGLLVTVVSALLPAIRASRVAPLEAVRGGGQRERSTRFRIVTGALVLVPGLIMLGVGMFVPIDSTTQRLALLGVGAALTFVGTSMVSGLFAGPVVATLGRPVESIKGITGRIARDNASRNPQRTAATSTALMIGLALITGVSVLTASLLATFDDLLEDALTADLYIFEEQTQGEFSSTIIDELEALPDTDLVAGLTRLEIRIAGEVRDVVGFDTASGTEVVDYGIVEGTPHLDDKTIAVFKDRADELGLALGDTVPIEFEDGFSTELEVAAIYDDLSIIERSWLVDRRLSVQHVPTPSIGFVGVTYVEGTSNTDIARANTEVVTDKYPQLTVQDNTELTESVQGQISQLQLLMIGLLALCLVVALFGIINTMTLSVLERTREIGLLRAVGMTRSQLRSAVRWEAVVVGLFGTILGIAMGLLLGWAAVLAIPDSFVSKVGIPWGWIVVYLIGGALIGAFAALFPAYRASRMNVLDAISHE